MKHLAEPTRTAVLYLAPRLKAIRKDMAKLRALKGMMKVKRKMLKDLRILCNSENLKEKRTKRRKICFICDEVRDTDIKPYNQAGIGRCEQEQSRKKIQARTEFFLAKPTYRFHEAAKRLQVLQGGQSFDLYAIDIYYHKNCYIKYAINKPLSIEEEEQTMNDEKKEYVVSEFFRFVKWEVLRKKEAFLLHQLLSDFKSICEENDIEPPLAHTVS